MIPVLLTSILPFCVTVSLEYEVFRTEDWTEILTHDKKAKHVTTDLYTCSQEYEFLSSLGYFH